jgi:hypothetical protein
VDLGEGSGCYVLALPFLVTTCPLIPITNKLNTEKNYLKNDFIIQSCNMFYHKTQNFEDDGFTISSNTIIMDELEY